jgi:hypothetical protein
MKRLLFAMALFTFGFSWLVQKPFTYLHGESHQAVTNLASGRGSR